MTVDDYFLPRAPAFEKEIEGEQECAGADGGVGEVEGGPVVVACVEEDEVHDAAQTDAVNQIAGDAGEEERARAEHAVVRACGAEEVDEHGEGGEDGERGEHPTREVAAALQLPEGDAGVLGVGQIEHARDDGHVAPEAQSAHSPSLRRLIGEEETEGGDKIACAPAQVSRMRRHAAASSVSISASASMQRSHTVG